MTYLLEVNLCLLITYGYYHVVLRNNGRHHWNRFYLLSAALTSLILPLLQIPLWPADASAKLIVEHHTLHRAAEQSVSIEHAWIIQLYWIGFTISTLFLLYKLSYIGRLILKAKALRYNGQLLIFHELPYSFSFLGYLFLHRGLKIGSPEFNKVFQHEKTHIQQYHSLDSLLLEVLKIICWFNPAAWLMKTELRAIHEFLADEAVNKKFPKERDAYIQLIIEQACISPQKLLGNPFSKSLIKKRMRMMFNNQKSNSTPYWIATVILMCLFFTVGCTEDNASQDPQSVRHEIKVIKKEDGSMDTIHNEKTYADAAEGDLMEEDLQGIAIEEEHSRISGTRKEVRIERKISEAGDTAQQVYLNGKEVTDEAEKERLMQAGSGEKVIRKQRMKAE